jgi:hypothetical protein
MKVKTDITHARKEFDKIEHPFLDKNTKQTRIKKIAIM